MNRASSNILKKQRAKGTPSIKPPKPRSLIVIAIDGPAGAGKSTVAKALAKRLGFAYLDAGAMYRALTLKALRLKASLEDEKGLAELLRQTAIDVTTDEKGLLQVFLDKEDVTEAIRSLKVTNNTFYIAKIPSVREVMVERQRDIAKNQSVVVEGRDIGTVVFPKATKKFYLDADFKERSRRRVEELRNKGKEINEAALEEALKKRDTKDLTRSVGPLKKASDAILIDSTRLSIEQVVDKMISLIR